MLLNVEKITGFKGTEMEQFLECYLAEFKEAPRNSLHDRRNRKQMVEYINTLIQGCAGGILYLNYSGFINLSSIQSVFFNAKHSKVTANKLPSLTSCKSV